MIKDAFYFSLRSLRYRKLRAYLTMIGIFVGIAAVVALISMGQGLQTGINEEFEAIGSDRITVAAGGVFLGPTDTTAVEELTDKDLKVVKAVRGVELTVPVLTKTAKVEFDKEVEYLNIFAMPADTETKRAIEEISFFDIDEGRNFVSADRDKVILGYNIARETFDRDITLRERIFIEDESFDVVGIQKKAGTGVHDTIIRMPLDKARDFFEEPEKISTIFVKVQEGYDVNDVADRIYAKLRSSRDVKEDQEDFTVQTTQQSINQLTNILLVVQIILIGIAAISLIVGGIGIMNTMYTSILERTDEIGIMKALGAKNPQILLIFLVEAGILGTVGGIIGIIIGLAISYAAELVAIAYGITLFKAYISWILVIGALLFSFVVGALAGILPAIQASKMNPAEAIAK